MSKETALPSSQVSLDICSFRFYDFHIYSLDRQYSATPLVEKCARKEPGRKSSAQAHIPCGENSRVWAIPGTHDQKYSRATSNTAKIPPKEPERIQQTFKGILGVRTLRSRFRNHILEFCWHPVSSTLQIRARTSGERSLPESIPK